jgi:hypothetical protein
VTHEVIVQLIANTTTRTGLTVQCRLDENTYEKGIKISDAEFAAIDITQAKFRSGRNYMVAPRNRW